MFIEMRKKVQSRSSSYVDAKLHIDTHEQTHIIFVLRDYVKLAIFFIIQIVNNYVRLPVLSAAYA